MKKLAILGSTGSVGKSTLDVVSRHPKQFAVVALTARRNVAEVLEQYHQFKPDTILMTEPEAAVQLQKKLADEPVNVLSGEDALCELAAQADIDAVMSAIVGAAGLLPTLAAIQAGKQVLIANKEPLVMTGQLLISEAEKSGATILPIDSEHNAIFQCLPPTASGIHLAGVNKIHLTASGGPFLGKAWASLVDVTPAQACAHPNWDMGQKISIDSATMMNKGLELIEAVALFGLPASKIEVLIHPQSIIHSMVEYQDGSFLAQLGSPDMKIPIAHALSWPERIDSGAQTLDLAAIGKLDFQVPDMVNMPCLKLARDAATIGASAPAALNAANEIAVQAFLDEKIPFTKIPEIVESVLSKHDVIEIDTIETVLNIDNEARNLAKANVDLLSQ